jgi:adenylate cyclase
MRRRLTLASMFYLSMAALAVLLGGLLFVLFQGSRQAIVETSEKLRDSASEQVTARVEGYLAQAEIAVGALERDLRSGACALAADAIESCLFAIAAGNPNLSEVAFTHGRRIGFDDDGDPRVAPDGAWQTSVFRDRTAGAAQLCTRRTEQQDGRFTAGMRCRRPERMLLGAPDAHPIEGSVADPTEHLTFLTPASRALSGRMLWTDLSYAELDQDLPAPRRRVVVTVMKTIEDAAGGFLGVARIGLLARQIDDEIAAIQINADAADPFRIFVCDAQGRLITRTSPDDRLEVSGDDLRVVAARLPAVIARAVEAPELASAAASSEVAHGRFAMDGRTYIVSFRPLAHTQGWFVGVVGPEDYYLSTLRGTLRDLLALTVAVISIVLVGGVLTLRALRRGLSLITREADRMRAFDFTPSPVEARFRDVAAVLASVEQAKTAMRAMRKYVPIDLVRDLYETNHEPELGGRLEDVSLLFTDILDFTTLAETIESDRLARLLGHYFAAMTEAVQAADGTVDKYIGDAVMALWNAPRPCPDHAIKACEAALGCVARTEALFASEAWEGFAPFVTRFGLHRDRVMVGHFGAPDRLGFTAIGDGVNLAARLEGLNKQYGTTILVSETIERAARDHFTFRRIDRVAVKGKSVAVDVFELIGTREVSPARVAVARRYERALDAYLARDFAGALALLAEVEADGPSRVLAERCRLLREAPPPPDWDGTFVAKAK